MRLRSKLFLLSRGFIHYWISSFTFNLMIERVRVKRQWCQSVAPHLRTSNWWLGCLIFRWRIGREFTIIDQWSKTKEFYSTLSMVLWYIDLLIFHPRALKKVHTPWKYYDVFQWDHSSCDITSQLVVLFTEP